MNKYTSPNFDQSALITIDTQNDFTLDSAPALIPGTKDVIPKMRRLLNAYRNKDRIIVHVVRLYLQDGTNVDMCRREAIESGKNMVIPETDGADLVEEIKPNATVSLDSDMLLSGRFQKIGKHEYVMYKPRWGAFYGTRLEEFLVDNGCNTLVFSGCNYPNCPRTSIYEASERDFRVVLAKDAVSLLYPKGEEEMLNIGVNLLTTNELETHLSI